jgi:tripartite-type tricarboxylate transporter receptor subunit TctC
MTPHRMGTPMPRRKALSLGLGSAAALALPRAHAQAWPSRPIRMIVGFPPGGAADTVARAVQQPLQDALGQPVVVENRPGANGNIAGEAVAKAAPDGYTLLMGAGSTISVNPHLYARMPFDPNRDLIAVASAARLLLFLETHPKVPANTVQELVAHLRANPGRLTFGSPGNGSSPHLAGELMKAQLNLFATHIPYRGAAPAMTDLLGGQIDFMFDPGVGIPHVRAGRLKMLAVGSPTRSPQFPDVPTMAESVAPGFDTDTLFGFYLPGGSPAPVVSRLNAEISRIVRGPAAERIASIGAVPLAMAAQEFNDRIKGDSERFGKLIRERKIAPD